MDQQFIVLQFYFSLLHSLKHHCPPFWRLLETKISVFSNFQHCVLFLLSQMVFVCTVLIKSILLFLILMMFVRIGTKTLLPKHFFPLIFIHFSCDTYTLLPHVYRHLWSEATPSVGGAKRRLASHIINASGFLRFICFIKSRAERFNHRVKRFNIGSVHNKIIPPSVHKHLAHTLHNLCNVHKSRLLLRKVIPSRHSRCLARHATWLWAKLWACSRDCASRHVTPHHGT